MTGPGCPGEAITRNELPNMKAAEAAEAAGGGNSLFSLITEKPVGCPEWPTGLAITARRIKY